MIEHNFITSAFRSASAVSDTCILGDSSPIILPNMSNPLSGGFVVAVASVSSLGLFIDDNGLGVFGCGPYLR